MDDLPKMPPVFEVPPYRPDPAQPLTLSDMQRLVAQLAAPPSDKEMLRQFATAAMQGLCAKPAVSYSPDNLVGQAFIIAELAVAEFKRRTEGGE